MSIINEIPADELRQEDSLFSDKDIEFVNALFRTIEDKKNKVFKNSDREIIFKFSSKNINVNKVVKYFQGLGYTVRVEDVKPVTIVNTKQIVISWADLGWRDIDSKFNN